MNDQPADWSADRVIGVIRALAAEGEVPKHLEAGPITAEDSVATLGLDSLGTMYILERLEAQAGVPIPDDFIEQHDNIAEIATRLGDLVKGG